MVIGVEALRCCHVYIHRRVSAGIIDTLTGPRPLTNVSSVFVSAVADLTVVHTTITSVVSTGAIQERLLTGSKEYVLCLSPVRLFRPSECLFPLNELYTAAFSFGQSRCMQNDDTW